MGQTDTTMNRADLRHNRHNTLWTQEINGTTDRGTTDTTKGTTNVAHHDQGLNRPGTQQIQQTKANTDLGQYRPGTQQIQQTKANTDLGQYRPRTIQTWDTDTTD